MKGAFHRGQGDRLPARRFKEASHIGRIGKGEGARRPRVRGSAGGWGWGSHPRERDAHLEPSYAEGLYERASESYLRALAASAMAAEGFAGDGDLTDFEDSVRLPALCNLAACQLRASPARPRRALQVCALAQRSSWSRPSFLGSLPPARSATATAVPHRRFLCSSATSPWI